MRLMVIAMPGPAEPVHNILVATPRDHLHRGDGGDDDGKYSIPGHFAYLASVAPPVSALMLRHANNATYQYKSLTTTRRAIPESFIKRAIYLNRQITPLRSLGRNPMARFTKIIVPAVLAAVAATAAPAMASSAIHQPMHHKASAQYVGRGQVADLHRDINQLESRIDQAHARRQISTREAKSLRNDVRKLQRQFAQAQRRGLTRSEARSIELRIAQVNRALHAERRDGDWRRR